MSDPRADAAAALFGALDPDAVVKLAVFDADLRCLAVSPSMLGPPDPVGRPAAEVLPSGVAPALVAALTELRDEGGEDFRRFPRLSPPEADEPVYRVGCYRLHGDGEARFGVLAADITERRRAQRRVEANRARLEMAERLGGLGSWTWWPEQDNRWSWSEQLLELAGFAGAAKTPPFTVWLGLVEPEDRVRATTARASALAGTATEESVRQRLPDGSERVLRVMSVPSTVDGRVVRVDGVVQDVTAAARTAAQQQAVADLGRAALERVDFDELTRRAGDAVGATLGVSSDAPSDEDAAFVRAVANVLGAAMARERLETELERQAEARGRLLAEALDAEDRTRREISETLHDGPLQDLLALNQFVAQLEPSGERGAEHLERAQAGLHQAIAGLREVMLELHPVVLDVGGLDSALAAVAAQQGRLGGFETDVRIEPDARGVRDELVLSLARELLVNAAKHSQARHVAVAVRRDGGELVLEVTDDGVGIPAGRLDVAVRDGHIGLASSRQRVEAEGGNLSVAGGDGGGTRVTAVVPAVVH